MVFINCLIKSFKGLNHPLHGKVHNLLGYYYAEINRLDDAKIVFESAVVIYEKVLGANNLVTGEVSNTIV